MQPTWKQDTKGANMQPRNLPQYEAAGAQCDGKHYQVVLRRTLTQATLVGLVLVIATFALVFRNSLSREKEGFAQFKPPIEEPTRDAIMLNILEAKRMEALEGWLFKTHAQKNYIFVTVKVRVRNTGRENYRLDPFGFSIFTNDGGRINASLKTRQIDDRLDAQILEPAEEVDGFVVFEVPKNVRPNTIQIGGGAGIVAQANLF